MDKDFVLRKLLPARLDAVDVMGIAIRYLIEGREQLPIEILIDGKLAIDGNAHAFIDPALIAGVVHARALLDFLGLRVAKGRLGNISRRQPDDVGIERFHTPMGKALAMVTPAQAVSKYAGPPAEAEGALVTILTYANKAVAHNTWGILTGDWQLANLEIAQRALRPLVISFVYTPLGISEPETSLSRRSRLRD